MRICFLQFKKKYIKQRKTNKQILNVMDKKKYVLQISALKFYLEHGLKLKKVHRVISFNQADFLKPYIDFNTEKRKNAKTEFKYIKMETVDIEDVLVEKNLGFNFKRRRLLCPFKRK